MIDTLYFQRWLNGIPYETAFWRSYYGSKRRRQDLFSWSEYGKPCRLDCFDVQEHVSALDNESPLVVDMGCALSYAMGNLFPGKPKVRIDYVDPLAYFYNKILDDYKVDRPRIKFGMIEGITGSYESDSVDLIHVRNALDHCADPVYGIVQAVDCLRPEGILYLNHFRNEALNEGYRGFHQWNIDIYEDRLVIWNKEERIDVQERLGASADVAASVSPEGRIVGVIRKNGFSKDKGVSRDATANSLEMMMATVVNFYSAPKSLKFQLLRLWTTLGHRTMRLLPYSLLRGVKRMMSKNK